MTLVGVLVVAAALFAIGLYGALSQQSIVMLMMGLELIIAAALLVTVAMWRFAAGGGPQGQLLAIIGLASMAVEMAIGFAVVLNLYRVRAADTTEKIEDLKA